MFITANSQHERDSMTIPVCKERVSPIREEHIRRGAADRLRSELTRRIKACELSSELDQIEFAREHLSLLERYAPEVIAGVKALQVPGGPEVFIAHDLPGSEHADDILISEVMSLMLAELFGPDQGPMQFLQEKSGRLISVLAVHPDKANDESGQGQREFGHHCDFAHTATSRGTPDVDGRPNFVILAGVKSDGTATTYTSVNDLLDSAFSPEAFTVLSEKRFEVPLPAEMGLGDITSGAMSVLFKTRHDEWGISVRSSTRPLRSDDAEAAEALALLQSALRRHERRFVVQRNTYVITSNLKGSHARGEITNPGERLVLRLYVAPLGVHQIKTNVFDLRRLLPRQSQAHNLSLIHI